MTLCLSSIMFRWRVLQSGLESNWIDLRLFLVVNAKVKIGIESWLNELRTNCWSKLKSQICCESPNVRINEIQIVTPSGWTRAKVLHTNVWNQGDLSACSYKSNLKVKLVWSTSPANVRLLWFHKRTCDWIRFCGDSLWV